MNRPKHLLVANVAWAHETAAGNPAFFRDLGRGQNPHILWIGCADSRVPAETITRCEPGDLFVHRNIANLFHPDDDNAASVLEYAVRVLKVGHVIVCGHYGCGGVRAALLPPDPALEARIVDAVEVSAAKPCAGLTSVSPLPRVRIMRQPPI